MLDQISAVYGVLHDLRIDEKRTLLVINKMDAPGAERHWQAVVARYPHAIPISARAGLGLDRLATTVSHYLSDGFVTLNIQLHVGDGRTLAWLSQVGEVISKQFHDDSIEIHARLPARHVGRLLYDGIAVEVLSGQLPEARPAANRGTTTCPRQLTCCLPST